MAESHSGPGGDPRAEPGTESTTDEVRGLKALDSPVQQLIMSSPPIKALFFGAPSPKLSKSERSEPARTIAKLLVKCGVSNGGAIVSVLLEAPGVQPPASQDDPRSWAEGITSSSFEQFKPIIQPGSHDTTEEGLAERLRILCGADFRFLRDDSSRGRGNSRTLHYDGSRWADDLERLLEHQTSRLADQLGIERLALFINGAEPDDALPKALHKARGLMRSRTGKTNVPWVLERSPGMTMTSDRFDRPTDLLNVLNGTLDLNNGKLRLHRREDWLRKVAAAEYRAEAEAPHWMGFLKRVTGDDPEMVQFLQNLFGYALVAGNPDQVFVFLYGDGNNGKSTFLKAVARVLGDYAVETSADTFLVRRNRNVRDDLMRLQGMRLVSAHEVRSGELWDESIIKNITGGEAVTARELYGRIQQFDPLFLPVVSANSRPHIRATDHGFWRRLVLVPFDVRIPDEEVDKHLPRKLEDEHAGILAWLVKGYRSWREEGLVRPQRVMDAVASYQGETNPIRGFIDEKCSVHESSSITKAKFYDHYKDWAERSGLKPVSKPKVRKHMVALGFAEDRQGKHGDRVWLGLNVGPPGNIPDEDEIPF